MVNGKPYIPYMDPSWVLRHHPFAWQTSKSPMLHIRSLRGYSQPLRGLVFLIPLQIASIRRCQQAPSFAPSLGLWSWYSWPQKSWLQEIHDRSLCQHEQVVLKALDWQAGRPRAPWENPSGFPWTFLGSESFMIVGFQWVSYIGELV